MVSPSRCWPRPQWEEHDRGGTAQWLQCRQGRPGSEKRDGRWCPESAIKAGASQPVSGSGFQWWWDIGPWTQLGHFGRIRNEWWRHVHPQWCWRWGATGTGAARSQSPHFAGSARKQHYVKMSRQYYRSSTRPTTRPRAQYSKENGQASNVTCLSCGGNHRTSQCPKKPASHSTAAQPKSKSQPHSSAIGPGASREPLSWWLGDHAWNSGAIKGHWWGSHSHSWLSVGTGKSDGAQCRALCRQWPLPRGWRGPPGVWLREFKFWQKPFYCMVENSGWWSARPAQGTYLFKGQGPILFSIEALRTRGAVVNYEHDLTTDRIWWPVFSVAVCCCWLITEQLNVGEEAGMQCSHIAHIHRSMTHHVLRLGSNGEDLWDWLETWCQAPPV